MDLYVRLIIVTECVPQMSKTIHFIETTRLNFEQTSTIALHTKYGVLAIENGALKIVDVDRNVFCVSLYRIAMPTMLPMYRPYWSIKIHIYIYARIC